MNQFIIDEKDLNRACDQMTAGGYGVSANYIDAMVRSHPLSAELKAERERVLDAIEKAARCNWEEVETDEGEIVNVVCVGEILHKIEELRGEP